MSVLQGARRALVDVIVGATSDLQVPVYEAWPSNVSAPCVVVSLQGGEQLGQALWHVTLRATLVAAGGDNVAAVEGVERLIERVVPALSAMYAQPVSWDSPGTITVAGGSVLAVEVEVEVDISLEGD